MLRPNSRQRKLNSLLRENLALKAENEELKRFLIELGKSQMEILDRLPRPTPEEDPDE